jgi:hypothetical protein
MRSTVAGDLKAPEKTAADSASQRKGESAKENKKIGASESGGGETEDESDTDKDYEREMEMRCRLVLTCFAPDGSPLLGTIPPPLLLLLPLLTDGAGKSFEVDHTGATIGRKTTNKIALVRILGSSSST